MEPFPLKEFEEIEREIQLITATQYITLKY